MTSYAELGPAVPEELDDTIPLSILRIQEMRDRNGLGEVIVLVDARDRNATCPVKLILGCNPHTGDITRAALMMAPGAGFVATHIQLLPGNLRDIVKTLLLDPRPT